MPADNGRMSRFHEKAGKVTGVSGPDLARASNVGTVAPGKTNLVQSHNVGDQWIDRGAVRERVGTAATNYKFALTQLRFDELIKKDDSLALDLVGAHFIGVAARALSSWKKAGIAKLESMSGSLTGFGEVVADTPRREERQINEANTDGA